MEIELKVSKQCQSASGGSFVAKYLATVELSFGRGAVEINIISTIPSNADTATVADVSQHIRNGAGAVLSRHGLDGRMVVSNLVIHPVDCNPRYYERFTAEEMDAAIAASGISKADQHK